MDKLSRDMIFKIFSYLTRYDIYLVGKTSQIFKKCFREYENTTSDIYCLKQDKMACMNDMVIGYCKHYDDIVKFVEKRLKDKNKKYSENQFKCTHMKATEYVHRYFNKPAISIFNAKQKAYPSTNRRINRYFDDERIFVFLLNKLC